MMIAEALRIPVFSCPAAFSVVREPPCLIDITGQKVPQHEASGGHYVRLILTFEVLVNRSVPAGTRALFTCPK
jgi:hypothetical protein